jgi:hypothetical protein
MRLETTWRCIPEGCYLQTRHRENLKLTNVKMFIIIIIIALGGLVASVLAI